MLQPLFAIPPIGGGGGGPCYVNGTRIAALHGGVRVEDLTIGTLLLTASGEPRPVRWLGRRSYSRAFAAGNRCVLPIRFTAGALADGVPHRDLWVSPEHAMWLGGMLIPARALVNGVSIVQEASVDSLHYVHVELETHEVIYAEGAAAETFVDDASREMFDNVAEYHALYPDAPTTAARFYGPRVEDGEALEAVRRRLAARAGTVTSADGQFTWCGHVDVIERGRIAGWALDTRDPQRAVAVRITDNGIPLGRVRADGFREDLAAGGVGNGHHAFSFEIAGGLAPDIDHWVDVRRADDDRAIPGSPFLLRAYAAPDRSVDD